MSETLNPMLKQIFNSILNNGYIPRSWCVGVIVPVPKKGNLDNPDNYRGITLMSCLLKIFTGILNERLINWSNKNSTITDAQFGFKPGSGTVDAIFA